MTLVEELAQLLHNLGLGAYRADGSAGGDIFLFAAPTSPDSAITITPYAGVEADSKLGYDEPRFQIRTRAPAADSRVAMQRAQAIYDALHGLSNLTLPGGTWLCLMIGLQSGPASLGRDANGRLELVLNFRAELRRTTIHRR